jgi:hypothetical protein
MGRSRVSRHSTLLLTHDQLASYRRSRARHVGKLRDRHDRAVGRRIRQHRRPAASGVFCPTVFAHACRLGAEGIVSKRVDGTYRSGPCPIWIKVRNRAGMSYHRDINRSDQLINTVEITNVKVEPPVSSAQPPKPPHRWLYLTHDRPVFVNRPGAAERDPWKRSERVARRGYRGRASGRHWRPAAGGASARARRPGGSACAKRVRRGCSHAGSAIRATVSAGCRSSQAVGDASRRYSG